MDYDALTRMMANILRHEVPMAVGIMVDYWTGITTLLESINLVDQLGFVVDIYDLLRVATSNLMRDGKPQFEVAIVQEQDQEKREGTE